jgi:hypothetical protein
MHGEETIEPRIAPTPPFLQIRDRGFYANCLHPRSKLNKGELAADAERPTLLRLSAQRAGRGVNPLLPGAPHVSRVQIPRQPPIL